MELSKFNPFPLNIKPKIDSWEKLQLLQHIDPQLKLTAAELNRILAALQYLYSNVSVSEYVSNVPVQMRGLAVNFKASGSQLQKVVNAINSMPNYVINDGNLIFFYTQRIVNSSISDIKLSLTAVHGVKSYSVITEYYILSRRIPTIGGIASVGIDGTPVSEADLIPLPPRDTRSVPPQEYYLGEIGTAEVSEVVNEGSLLATPRGYTVIFRAKRSGEEVIYLYEGLEAEVGDGAEATSEADFREFPSDEADLDPSPPPVFYLFKKYETISDMIADIGNQTASDILFVVDASDDPDLDFTGIGKKHAYYRRNYDQADAQLASYLLISAPYAATGGAEETITTSSGSVIAEPTPTSFLKFTNQTTPVILSGLTDVKDGKEVTIWNESLQQMDLLHDSSSALAAERLHILGERDVLLPVGGKAIFRYSESESQWTMIGIFGAGYHPTLIGSTKRAVTVSASGVVDSEELMEMMVWNTGITTNQTNEDLNLAYPNAMNGFTVVAVNNNREYVMYDDTQGEWFFRQITKLGVE